MNPKSTSSPLIILGNDRAIPIKLDMPLSRAMQLSDTILPRASSLRRIGVLHFVDDNLIELGNLASSIGGGSDYLEETDTLYVDDDFVWEDEDEDIHIQ